MASMISNIVETIYRVRGGNQLAQESRLIANGIGGIGRQIDNTSRLSERFNSQWRAIGTTLRYAVAGGVVFGLTRMVSQLSQVQQQLGLMQAIGQPAGGSGIFSNRQITNLGNSLQRSAMDAITPINEINDATVNLLSTVQNVPGSEIPNIITNIGRAAKLSQTPIEDLTKAATTMNIAFGRANNLQTIEQFNRMWFALIKTAPGGVSAAPEIANQLPQLASMFALGHGPVSGKQSQSEMFSDILGVLTTGSPPSVGLRGLSYLLNSIILPTSNKKALAAIGITPESISKEGIQVNLNRLLKTITNTGNISAIKGLDDSALDQLDSSGQGLPGIPASEMTRLRELVPRIHGQRAAVILAQRLRSTPQSMSLDQSGQMFSQAQDDLLEGTNNFARGWQDLAKRSRLAEASVALDTLRLQIAQVFEPIFNLASRGISGVASQAQHHRNATTAVVGGAAAMAAALGVKRFLLPGLRMGGTGLVTANAAKAAIENSGVLGASPQNPLYVVVVSQLFGSGGNKLAGKVEGEAGESTAKKVARKTAPWLAPVASRAAAISGPAIAAMIPLGAGVLTYEMIANRNSKDPRATGARRYPRVEEFLSSVQNSPYGTVNPKWMDVFQRYMQQQLSPGQLNQMLGRADVNMNLRITDSKGNVTVKKVHIPVDFKNGVVPTSRGKKAVKHG